MGAVAVRRARSLLGWLAAGFLVAGSALGERATEPGPSTLVVYADVDDDDNDGLVDHDAPRVKGRARASVRRLTPELGDLLGLDGSSARLLSGGQPLLGKSLPGKELRVQGVSAGESKLRFSKGEVLVQVLELRAYDHEHRPVDLATSHASISRVVPSVLSDEQARDDTEDPDALYWMVMGDPAYLPDELALASISAAGRDLDTLEGVPLSRVSCPGGVPEYECRRSPAIRAVGDATDRSHPAIRATSLLAEVGGRITVQVDTEDVVSIRVGGPRHTELGPIARLRATINAHVVRATPGGTPPVGGDEAGAIRLLREELRIASGLWGQCGIHFGLPEELEVRVVDPPPPSLLAIGCDLGLPASGGAVRFRVGSAAIEVPTEPGETPSVVAEHVVQALERAGLRAALSANAKIARGALRTVDVSISDEQGKPVPIELPASGPLSTDATLSACVGEVELSDGLTHFSDFDAAAGTVEERSLIKAFDDGDPTTIELFVIPSFAHSGRIGESFIYADGASVRNVVIIDRAGIRAGARSHTLAHELGHILLDMPGHPDDYGVDMPSTLMDADAADATIFGPRRLSVAECERALRQSGPGTPAPLLSPWPLYGEGSEQTASKGR